MNTRKILNRKNPTETSNFLSLLFFGWTAPIFWKGTRRGLELTDLYSPLKSDESEILGDRLEKEWKKELLKSNQELKLGKDGRKKSTGKPSLTWALVRMFWFPYIIQVALILIQCTVLRVAQAILQGWVISYFNPGENLMTKNEVLIYAGLLITVTLVMVFIIHHTGKRFRRMGMCVRVACCSLIYRKVLRLDKATVNSTAADQVVNLMSNDVARFDQVFTFLHYICIIPIQLSLVGYVLWESMGTAALIAITSMIVQTVMIEGYSSTNRKKLRSKIAVKTDERVQLMSELIAGIQVVKMYAWEKPFELIVSKIRTAEMKTIGYTSYLKAFHHVMILFSGDISRYLTLIAFVLTGNSLTAEITFVLTSLIGTIKLTCAKFVPQAINLAGETAVSLERLTKFLLLDEVKCPKKVDNELRDAEKTITNQLMEHGVGIKLVNVAANWVHGELPPTLCDVSMEVKSRSLCAVVGCTGSGKSSLLHLLLGELSTGAGKLLLFTGEDNKTRISSGDIRISYTSQDSWLFSATIRENILFGEPYDEKRYQEVTRACALLEDFKQLPQGDLSFVGERGAALSGGQKARVNLARAVYRDADLYLLDDPLSAVDPRVGRHLFEECITGFLNGKTRILVTHQRQYLRHTDNIVVLNRGTVERQGTYEELATSEFHILDSEETEDVEKIDKNDEILQRKTSLVSTNDNDQPNEVTGTNEESQDINTEQIAKGNISSSVYWGYISAGGNTCSLALLALLCIIGRLVFSTTNYWVTYWTDQEVLRDVLHSNTSISNEQESQWFDEYGFVHQHLATYIYTICLVSSILLLTLRSMLFMRICVNASRNIHNSVFKNLLQAPMRFFNTHPSEIILNRFSKDVGSMDELLPTIMLETLQIGTLLIAMVVTMTIINSWMILPAVIMGGISYGISIWYFKTAQDIMRLESITKSPVLSHVNSTLDGLTTIRSRGPAAEGFLRREFDQHQDVHSGAWFLTFSTASASGFYLDLVSSTFIACVCFLLIITGNEENRPGLVGLAISQSLTLTGMIQYGVRKCALVVTHMTSVERLLQYTRLPKEGPFTSENPPPPTWPSNGSLVIQNALMRYADNKPLVLKNLNLSIHSGWKVGIVGGTEAEKSLLISALFRLTEDGLEGEIILDGIDTKSIGLGELRPRISIIPQEPILFSSSLRHNLDPFEHYSDAELWDSLREVELSDVVSSLDFQVAQGGANFSVGQRQLICLARAILRNNRLLVLEEATANIDQSTDALIQTTIRRRFADCTVLTIAHRLNTIMDSDRVLVISDGCIVESGHPHTLLKNRDGHFSQMVQETGKLIAEKLAGIAEKAFLLSPRELIDGTVTESTDQITHL